jgi:hypothetical protein
MTTMLQTIQTAKLTGAARAASVPCRHYVVVDASRSGFASTLVERCMR